MTTESAVAKLYYLFSKGYSKEEIKIKMEENLRGELTK
jgi:L-asparaginase